MRARLLALLTVLQVKRYVDNGHMRVRVSGASGEWDKTGSLFISRCVFEDAKVGPGII